MKKNRKENPPWITAVLTLLFVGMKLTGAVSWSWLWVLAPIWIPFALLIGIHLIEVVGFWMMGSESRSERQGSVGMKSGSPLRCSACEEVIPDTALSFCEVGKPEGEGRFCCSLTCVRELAIRDSPGDYSEVEILGGEWVIKLGYDSKEGE